MMESRVRRKVSASSPVSSVLDNLDDVTSVETINGVIFSPPGCGKTHLLCTAGEYSATSPALIVTYDKKDPTLSKFADKVDVIDIPRVARESRKTITETTEKLVGELEKPSKYKFVGIDGLSKLINPYVRREIVAEETKRRDRGHDPDILDEHDYARANVRTFAWIERLRAASIDMGFHLFITAREREEDVQLSKDSFLTIRYPDLTPELRRLAMYEVDFCYRLDVSREMVGDPSTTKTYTRPGGQKAVMMKKRQQIVRILQTRPSRELIVKDRLERVPHNLKNPTVEIICRCSLDGYAPAELSEEAEEED